MSKVSKFFHRPPRYVIASLICSVGGFLQGIDTGIIGPVTVMDKYVEHFGYPSPAIHGLVVSSILLSAAVTSFLAGHVADSLGRSSGIAIGGLIFALGAVLEAGAVHLGMFIAGRLVVIDILAPEARSRFFMALFLMGMQQLSGIDGVLYYAPLLFRECGIGADGDTFLVSGVLAIVIVAVTIPGTIWADNWGRRPNTIFGGLAMAGCMFLLGSLYTADVVHAAGAARWIVVVTIYVFTVIYCVSWGIVLKIYAAEIQPQRTRATATSIAHGANWLTNFLVALITPILLSRTSFGAYFLFAGCLSVTALVCWFAMPETRRRTLAEIQHDFESSYADRFMSRKPN
ncbi:hypothetical protein PWT90_04805 [Aphanocladium album]|nr:hypothetical protein PWT90_04805 [Aphanocladium album]